MQIGFARATEQLFQKPVYSDTIKKITENLIHDTELKGEHNDSEESLPS